MNHAVASSPPPPRGSPSVRVMDTVPGRYRRRRHRSMSYSISAMGSSSSVSIASLVVSVGEFEGTSLGVVDGIEDGAEDNFVGASDAVGVEDGMSK